jgi:hypothetical protein
MSPETFAILALCICAAVWLIFGIARLQALWLTSGMRASQLKQGLISGAQRMVAGSEHQKQLDEEIKLAEETLAELKTAQDAKKRELASMPPPVPDEIEVSAEYPSSRTDQGWIAEILLDDDSRKLHPDWPPRRFLLLWAPGQMAAVARARQHSGSTIYEVGAVRRF